MSEQLGDKTKWNNRYTVESSVPPPAQVLIENSHLLPQQGSALDLACGLGANAVFLAKHGLKTCAWDISDVAINKLNVFAKSLSLEIETGVRDVVSSPPSNSSFDVIVVSRFLDRLLTGALIDALKPGGFIFYQTFILDKQTDIGPSNPEYLLKTNELLKLFDSLIIRVYREEGLAGNMSEGFRNEAMLVAQKPV